VISEVVQIHRNCKIFDDICCNIVHDENFVSVDDADAVVEKKNGWCHHSCSCSFSFEEA